MAQEEASDSATADQETIRIVYGGRDAVSELQGRPGQRTKKPPHKLRANKSAMATHAL